MSTSEIDERILRAVQLQGEERYQCLLALHREALSRYTAAVRRVDQRDAARISSDGRAIAQVVAHIADWDRYFILAAGEIAAGVQWPQFMELNGYVMEDGSRENFAGINEFNAFSALRTADWSWDRIQRMAVQSAQTLFAMYSNPNLLSMEKLETTRAYQTEEFGFPLSIPVGIYLWVIAIGHEMEEHALDLKM